MKTYIDHVLQDQAFRPAFVEGSLVADAHLLLAQAMQASGLSYADVGMRMGVTKARAHKVFAGEGNLTLGLMSKAAAALGLAWGLRLDNLNTGAVSFVLEPIKRARTDNPRKDWKLIQGGLPAAQAIEANEVSRCDSLMRA